MSEEEREEKEVEWHYDGSAMEIRKIKLPKGYKVKHVDLPRPEE